MIGEGEQLRESPERTPASATAGLPDAVEPAEPTERQQRRRRLGILGLSLAAVVSVAFAVTAVVIANHRPRSSSSPSGGATLVTYTSAHQSTVAPLDLATLGSSERFHLSALGKRPFVINFFASWCTACQAELGAVASVANAYRATVPFFGIDTNETGAAQAVKMLHRAHASYPVGVGGTTQANEFLVPGLPTTVFVNAEGRTVGMAYGQVSRGELAGWVQELAAGKPLQQAS